MVGPRISQRGAGAADCQRPVMILNQGGAGNESTEPLQLFFSFLKIGWNFQWHQQVAF